MEGGGEPPSPFLGNRIKKNTFFQFVVLIWVNGVTNLANDREVFEDIRRCNKMQGNQGKINNADEAIPQTTANEHMQKNPRKLCYKRMPSNVPKHLKIIGDSSFKKEEEKGHSLRGVLIVLCSGSDMTKGGIVHILDFATKALRLVTRSTFSAELLGGCDSFDLGLMILFILNEIHAGVPSKLDARSLRENGGFSIPAVLCLDALSVFAAVTATYIKPPAEKGLLAHVQYLRELLDRHVLYALMWLDTRDMTADGMTKGAVERLALHLLMAGEIQIKHEPKLWKASI